MMQTSLMCKGDALNFLIKKHHAVPTTEPSQKIIPLVGARGFFDYDVLNDKIKCDEINRLMVGLDSNIYKFSDILEKVEGKTRFMEQTVGYSGDEKIVYSSPILLNNGNEITAKYYMTYSKKEPDLLIRMTGESQLIKVA